MSNRFLVLSTFALLSACSSSGSKMDHPELGIVSVNDSVYIQERDDCVAEFMQAESNKTETKEQEKAIKTTSILSNDLSAIMELSSALGSNKKAMAYTDDCLEKKGWSKHVGS